MRILFDPIPLEARLKTFANDQFTFDYPAEARIAIFEHEGLPNIVRVVYDTPDKRFRFNMELMNKVAHAKEAAQQGFEGAALFLRGNVEPFQLDIPLEGWRCRKRFADGGHDPAIIDMSFFELPTGVYRLSLFSPSPFYETVKWVFDLITKTLRPTT